jgi:hypothetical protein
MNDSLEVEWFMNLSKSVLNETASHFQELSSDHAEYYRALDGLLSRNPFEHIYIGSFSSKPDDLSQWRAYSNDGSGVSIGCDLQAILNENASIKALSPKPLKVKYSEIEARKSVKKAFESQEFIGTPYIEIALKAMPNRSPQWLAMVAFMQLAAKSPTFKNPAFRGESEVRLLAEDKLRLIGKPADYDDDLVENFGAEIDFRVDGDRMVPFVPIKFPLEALHEVWLGPCFRGKKEEKALQLLLKKLKCNAVVKRSAASYRR